MPESSSPTWYSPGSFSRRRAGASASVAAPMFTKTPKATILVTVPVTSSPTEKSAADLRLETARRCVEGLHSEIFRPVIFSPGWYSLAGLSSWLEDQRASRSAPMSMKTPKGALRFTTPVTSWPTFRFTRRVGPAPPSEDADLERPSRELTSIWPASSLTCVTMRPSCSSPTLYSEMSLGSAAVRQSASVTEPMSKKTPMSAMPFTLPVTVEPRITFESGVPMSPLVVTEILLPCTLKTVRSATSPTEYSVGALER
mmetsp:Transcript_98903/g.255698  ORF Transcript_98903/g.255698 Transcript_98903/m.255698 type:complete len:256 (-) Transcript_98903:855-1622(-)